MAAEAMVRRWRTARVAGRARVAARNMVVWWWGSRTEGELGTGVEVEVEAVVGW